MGSEYTNNVLSDVVVDTESCAYERIVTGPMHASTFTCTFSAVIDAFESVRAHGRDQRGGA